MVVVHILTCLNTFVVIVKNGVNTIDCLVQIILVLWQTNPYWKGRATNEGLTNTVLKWTFAQNKNKTYSSVLHWHTVLMTVCPCGRYKQLNSVVYPKKHILKSSKIVSNGLVLKYV